jgi:hypothetical protein
LSKNAQEMKEEKVAEIISAKEKIEELSTENHQCSVKRKQCSQRKQCTV